MLGAAADRGGGGEPGAQGRGAGREVDSSADGAVGARAAGKQWQPQRQRRPGAAAGALSVGGIAAYATEFTHGRRQDWRLSLRMVVGWSVS